MGKGSRLFRPRKVTGGGGGLSSRAGLMLVGEVMTGTGLTGGFQEAFSGWARRRHDPGVGFAQVVTGLIDGAKTMTDVTGLVNAGGLFAQRASNTTMADWFNRIASGELGGISRARASARARAWAAGAGPSGSELIIDVDATLIAAVDTKAETGPNYKGGYGFKPLVALCAETGEVFEVMLRAGNAGSNTAADHVELIDTVIAGLPERWRTGHHWDTNESPQTRIIVRADTAGATGWFIEHCLDSNLEFSFGLPIDNRVRDGLLLAQEEHWTPARNTDGTARRGAQVLEITNLIDHSYGPGVRVIARRERPHPGAQLGLFDTVNGWRHQVFITNSCGRAAGLEHRHRRRGTAERVIADLKACGAANLPFTNVVSNQAWITAAATAVDVLAWTRTIGLNGQMKRARPKTIRYRLLHVAARITATGQALHYDTTWPWTRNILNALKRITKAFNQPLTVTTPAA